MRWEKKALVSHSWLLRPTPSKIRISTPLSDTSKSYYQKLKCNPPHMSTHPPTHKHIYIYFCSVLILVQKTIYIYVLIKSWSVNFGYYFWLLVIRDNCIPLRNPLFSLIFHKLWYTYLILVKSLISDHLNNVT